MKHTSEGVMLTLPFHFVHVICLDDEKRVRVFYDKRMSQEVPADSCVTPSPCPARREGTPELTSHRLILVSLLSSHSSALSPYPLLTLPSARPLRPPSMCTHAPSNSPTYTPAPLFPRPSTMPLLADASRTPPGPP